MKKLIISALCAALMLSFAACGDEPLPKSGGVSYERVEYDGGEGGALSISLPENWDSETYIDDGHGETFGDVAALAFWPEDDPDMRFELEYWPSFGMCGTGVTIKEIKLENGASGHKYTEWYENTIWLTVSLKAPEKAQEQGAFIIRGSLDKEKWEFYEETFDGIVKTAEFS